MIQEVYGEEKCEDLPEGVPSNLPFPVGKSNDAFAQYFVGQSYLAPLTMEQVPTFNVTFEPSCRNNWHIHHASCGGGHPWASIQCALLLLNTSWLLHPSTA